ncbi:MAG: hypothetical protein LCI00_15640 [Chloroflexi bacterium]|nr:hypothetical protein [Chloroflexota bacterium]
MKPGKSSNDVPMLLVEMLESSILMENIHALPLRKNYSDRAVFEDQTGFPIQHDAHLLVES